MQSETEVKRRFPIPPWTILVLQLVWVCGVLLAVHTGLALHNVYHAAMAVVGLVVVVGLSLRWRLALWASALVFAAAAGGTIVRKLATLGTGFSIEERELFLNIALVVQVGGWVLHQTPTSFRWFGFEPARPVRLWFWVVSTAGFCIWAVLLYHGSPQTD